MERIQLKEKIKRTIKTLVNSFKERPDNFLTENDLHAYIYHSFYLQPDFSNYKGKVTLVHLEYPTIKPIGDKNTRGSFDVAILNPDIVIEYVEGGKILELRNKKKEMSLVADKGVTVLLAALEFKFIQQKDIRWINKIEYDIKKLSNHKGVDLKYALVFDNINSNLGDKIKTLQEKYDNDVIIKYIPRNKK